MKVAEKEEWIGIVEAAKRLGISHMKLRQVVAEQRFQTKRDPKDARLRLVNFTVLKAYFEKPTNEGG